MLAAASLLPAVAAADVLILEATTADQAALQQTIMGSPEIAFLTERYGLGKPIYTQYWRWISGIFRGDFGESFEWRLPVSQLIGQRLLLARRLAEAGVRYVTVVDAGWDHHRGIDRSLRIVA